MLRKVKFQVRDVDLDITLERERRSFFIICRIMHLNVIPAFKSNSILFRNSYPGVLLGKSVLKICSKFTGQHPCRSAISIENTSGWVISSKYAAYFQNIFS